MLAHTEFLDEGDNLSVTLKEVVVEVLKRVARDRERGCLATETAASLPSRHPLTGLCQSQRRRQTGDTAADHPDVPAGCPPRRIAHDRLLALRVENSNGRTTSGPPVESTPVRGILLDEERREHQRDRRQQLDQDV
jgi:hypothetical protein